MSISFADSAYPFQLLSFRANATCILYCYHDSTTSTPQCKQRLVSLSATNLIMKFNLAIRDTGYHTVWLLNSAFAICILQVDKQGNWQDRMFMTCSSPHPHHSPITLTPNIAGCHNCHTHLCWTLQAPWGPISPTYCTIKLN